eukprot:CAMPEP_0118934276 /NCGR_PEP_ID=MMETSP1169-20130426/13731_1 /TAXON_ID=36882 /ORGANISM="Pyramimonas obovata, Strain CCMP722" /LENGTH=494 /DNA_ID=CAMNT_0006877159 /DNA_START=282 /DNA_END=1766 /DNA_ORIENTATION=+
MVRGNAGTLVAHAGVPSPPEGGAKSPSLPRTSPSLMVPSSLSPSSTSLLRRRKLLGPRALSIDGAIDSTSSDTNRSGVTGGTVPGKEKIGVLLLNLGGPDKLEDVQPFLYNLFADPDIIRLPKALQWLQKPIATFAAAARAPQSSEAYASIGGGSPLRKITEDQAEALKDALDMRGQPVDVYVGMRYWKPFTEDAIQQIKQDRIQKLVVLPLYPQFSISTSGSSLRLLEDLFKSDEYLYSMPHTVIPSWYQRPGYVRAMADLIVEERNKVFEEPDKATIFFSAHGVPKSYVEEGDPYKEEMEECVQLIMAEVKKRGVNNDYVLAYQSRVGPVEWLQPYTEDSIKSLGQKGCKDLLAVPISFVSEHIETLEEIDMEYRELAEESGIENWGRVPALNVNPIFIEDLAAAVTEALPYVGTMGPASDTTMVPSGSVEDLLAAYDRADLALPPPVTMWQWGFTKSAETWNGRIAMIAVILLLVLEVTTGSGVLHNLRIL